MKNILFVLFALYLSINFVNAFAKWINSKDNREYGLRLVSTAFSGGMIFAFIKLIDILEVV